MADQLDDKNETHPLFPSGEWEGFYTYSMGSEADQHPMQFSLEFRDQLVSGGGSDDVGGFAWKGRYDTKALTCQMTKYYSTHNVDYNGQVDENGIWGTWTIRWMKGGFHIWPKKKGEEAAASETIAEIKKITIENAMTV